MTSRQLFVVLVRAGALTLAVLMAPVVGWFVVQGEQGWILGGPLAFLVLASMLVAFAPWLASRFAWPDDAGTATKARAPREWTRAAERLAGLLCAAFAIDPLARLLTGHDFFYEVAHAGLLLCTSVVLLFRSRMPAESSA